MPRCGAGFGPISWVRVTQVIEMEKNFRVKKMELTDGERKMSSHGQFEGLETVRILILRRKEEFVEKLEEYKGMIFTVKF